VRDPAGRLFVDACRFEAEGALEEPDRAKRVVVRGLSEEVWRAQRTTTPFGTMKPVFEPVTWRSGATLPLPVSG